MTLDIRGSLKNTRKSKNPYVVIDELIANAIDAFLIRQDTTELKHSLRINFRVKAIRSDLLGNEYDLEIQCSDNGCGLGPAQLQAFLTKDTSYKDDLHIPGIGNCKGAGRVQFFHHFSTISLASIYEDEGRKCIRLAPQENRKKIEEIDFERVARARGPIGTVVKLSGVLPRIRQTVFTVANVHDLLPAGALKQYVLFSMLQRFVSLKEVLGNFQIKFSSNLDGQKSIAVLQSSDIPKHTSHSSVEVTHVADTQTVCATLAVTHYKLDHNIYGLPRNIVGLCAKSAIAETITGRYLRTKAFENNPIDGFFHIILIEGDLLDEGVNEQRDGFDKICAEGESISLFDGVQITFDDIYTVLDTAVQSLLTPPDWSRDKIISDLGNEFGLSDEMLSHSNTRVSFGDSPITVAKRALKNLQEKVVDETASLVSLKETIKDLEPDSEDFRKKIDDIAWKFTSSLKTIDMANLSQLVVRRSSLIDVLDLAVKQQLKTQIARPEGKKRNNEALIHSIFFPMRKDSHEEKNHDIWLLSEEYGYYEYIASDKPLSRIRWRGEKMFEPDVDDEINAYLERVEGENKNGRPDIALFHEEGSVVIVEFKAPGVSLDKHDNDLTEYATILAAKSKRRLKKFYGYLIGDTINASRLRGYQPLAGGKGYFATSSVMEPTTGYPIGQLYSELISYEDVVDRARKRIGVYRDRLKLPKAL